ncbi:peptide chain release factor N(5)-glutamine methyltransferase [Robiginitalea sp. IMCC43444]|uniref:peptide chain release factor N(5)-glutamine methyltransferase n=1 Tax=Robiginitalea sp. IMCC43444 TaxID=3459121 RepID=UPI004042C59A
MQLKQIQKCFREQLSPIYPREEIDHMFHILLDHFYGLPRFILALEPDKSLSEEQTGVMKDALEQLKQHLPLQYITNTAYFMEMELYVDSSVLIPRPETETLVHWVIETAEKAKSGLRIIDLGSGSGCIGIGLARNLPKAEVHLLDISEKALQTALRNAKNQDVVLQGHLGDMRELSGDLGVFDIMVSNPPYVPESQKKLMRPNVREHEPSLALFVSDENPLEFYRAIAEGLRKNLKAGGWLFFEIHEDFGASLTEMLEALGYSEIQLKKDIFGKDRYVKARKKK